MCARVRAIKHSVVTLPSEHLEKTALSTSQCEKVLGESREGETRLTEDIREELGSFFLLQDGRRRSLRARRDSRTRKHQDDRTARKAGMPPYRQNRQYGTRTLEAQEFR